MHIVLLSGGSGKRLWPLSNEIRSKQFIKIFKTKDGQYQSMVQRIYGQIRSVDADSDVTIATSSSQVSSLKNQIGEMVDICVEPCRRDTFPAIALAAAYEHDVKQVGLEEAVVVCPIDPYVETDYFEMVKKISLQAQKGQANLVLMGIEPTCPSEKYGYIIPQEKSEISPVDTFKEKPDEKTAEQYIKQGALWNGGVFAFKLGYLLNIAHKLIDFDDYYDLFNKYQSLEKISFDYAVVENEPSIQVMRFNGRWEDIGTWNTLTEVMDESVLGNGLIDETCDNVHIVNELDAPILAMGLKNIVISASPDGILVADKDRTNQIKSYVDEFDSSIMYAEKSWGEYRVLDVQPESMTVRITLRAGSKMTYHSHEHRDEIWSIVSGNGTITVDGMKQSVSQGNVVTIQSGCRHTVYADTDLQLIEIQIGKEISANDKHVFELE